MLTGWRRPTALERLHRYHQLGAVRQDARAGHSGRSWSLGEPVSRRALTNRTIPHRLRRGTRPVRAFPPGPPASTKGDTAHITCWLVSKGAFVDPRPLCRCSLKAIDDRLGGAWFDSEICALGNGLGIDTALRFPAVAVVEAGLASVASQSAAGRGGDASGSRCEAGQHGLD